MLKEKPISKISITEICGASGVNRATFYKHYETPAMILREIAYGYAARLKDVYTTALESGQGQEAGVEACLGYLLEQKTEIKLLFSSNAENYMNGFGLEVVNDFVMNNKAVLRRHTGWNEEDCFLYAVLTASAAFGLVRVWLVNDIEKSPRELLTLLKVAYRSPLMKLEDVQETDVFSGG